MTPAGDAPQATERILGALARLDGLLERGVRRAQSVHGVEPGSDPHRGLYVSPVEAARLLARPPGTPLFPVGRAAGEEPLADFRAAYDLTEFDLEVVLLALAPEVDLRYERIYAFLHDDVTRRRPSVDLALNLLCRSPHEKIARRARFAPDAPLLAGRLLRLDPDGGHGQAPLLAQSLVLDLQVTRMLLGVAGGDPRLAGFVRLVTPGNALDDGRARALAPLARDARREHRQLLLVFEGPPRSGRRRAALELARRLGERLLDVDLARVRDEKAVEDLLTLALAGARLRRALPYVHGLERLGDDNPAIARLREFQSICVVAAPERPASLPPSTISVEFGALPFAARLERWSAAAARCDADMTDEELAALAARFRFSAGQIDDAAAHAEGRALWRAALTGGDPVPRGFELFAGARAQAAPKLGRLATKVEPRYGWGDIVLPDDVLAQLREIAAAASQRHVVFGEWGFGKKLTLGKGLSVLFSGSPGTGKTMAAEVIAGELRLDLYKVDLSQIVSKYIGETERNLAEVFREAATSSAILFFDEADALFGKRSEVKDAHDRYANIEIAYLLQKMEEYDGVVVLATNLRQNIDQAFLRRLQHVVEFANPDEAYRRRIWQVTFPPEAPVADDVDFGFLARALDLPGGNIRNIAVAAAFHAAADGGIVRMTHLELAARRELRKVGHGWDESAWPAHGAAA